MKKYLLIITIIIFASVPVFSQAVYQMLEVDGLKVTIDTIRFARGYADSTTIGSIDVNEQVNLTDNLSDLFSKAKAIRLDFGVDELSFDTIDIQLSSGVEIKGHTYLSDDAAHIYTTAGGIKKLTGVGSVWSEPSDYGYLAKQYLYYQGEDAVTHETTFLQQETTFSSTVPLDISLLVDTYQVAYYWDGEDASRHGFVQTWNWENPANFPAGTPVIGITYLPLYLSVNQSLSAETYVVAERESDLTPVFGNFYDEKWTMNMTLVFDDSNNFFIGRTANWDGLDASFKLPQFVRSAVSSGSIYTLTLNSYGDGLGWTNNSSIASFTRLTVGATGTFEFTDSDGITIPLFYKRVK